MSTRILTTAVISGGFGLTAALDSIGICYEQPHEGNFNLEGYGSVIIGSSGTPSTEFRNKLKDFVQNGGILLEIGTQPFLYDAAPVHRKWAAQLNNMKPNPGFNRYPVIDLFSECAFSQNGNSYYNGLINFQNFGKGFIGRFGLDLEQIWKSASYRRKRFFSAAGPAPDEIVAKTDRTRIVKVLETVLLELHRLAALPFIIKWHSPEIKPVFSFRIDTDFGNKDSVTRLFELAEKHKIRFTWFLHTQAHKEWLAYFREFGRHETALHCYRHGTSTSIKKIRNDIKTAAELLQAAGLNTNGYAAPYGILTAAHRQVLSEFDFDYSSDFSSGYDGLPFEIELPGNKQILQIPIHPICTGSLSRKRYSPEMMKSYFEHIIDDKIRTYEPILLYHHPLQPGLQVIDFIFDKIGKSDMINLTFLEYARFWKERNAAKIKVCYRDNFITQESDGRLSIILKISMNHEGFRLMHTNEKRLELRSSNDYSYPEIQRPTALELKSLQSKKLSLMKTSSLDYKNRIRL